jgi:uncharacterized protein YfbU (UPF0304 family)
MELTKKDRVLLINQYSILAILNEKEADHYNELINILANGYEIFYNKVDEWYSDDMPSDEGQFVLNILVLYRAIENLKLSANSSELNDHYYSFFRGFDGNTEAQYRQFARFIIETQGQFEEQKQYLTQNDNLNSHATMIDKYRRMLTAADDINNIYEINIEQALEILEA